MQLAQPIHIRLYQEGAYLFAENEPLRIWAHGTTIEEALADFCDHLRHFQQAYAQAPLDTLTGEAIRLKRKFARFMLPMKVMPI